MTPDEVADEISQIELDPERDSLTELEALLARLPEGDPGRRPVLTSLSDHAMLAGHHDQAMAYLTDAERVATGRTLHYIQAMRISHLLGAGKGELADPMIDDLRHHNDDFDGMTRYRVAEALEGAGRLKDAQRWFTMGLRDLDPTADVPDIDQRLGLFGRYRVRRELGLGLDAFDELTDRMRPDQPTHPAGESPRQPGTSA